LLCLTGQGRVDALIQVGGLGMASAARRFRPAAPMVVLLQSVLVAMSPSCMKSSQGLDALKSFHESSLLLVLTSLMVWCMSRMVGRVVNSRKCVGNLREKLSASHPASSSAFDIANAVMVFSGPRVTGSMGSSAAR
jgi:hypothetical protein